MKINKMDKRLLVINNIKDIISIDYKDIYYDGNQEKRHIMPGFLVFYGNLDSIYLTIDDPFFEEFVRKIRNVYLEEKDYVQSGVLKNKKIQINSLTESILLNGSLDNINSLYAFYEGKDSYKESLLFETDMLHSFFNIIEYHLRKTLKIYDKTLGSVELSNGINGNYYLKATINNQTVLLPLYFEYDNNSFTIIVGNLLEDSLPINMHIELKDNGITVKVIDKEHKITDLTKYGYQNKALKERRLVMVNNEIVSDEEELLPKEDNPLCNLTSVDNDLNDPTWFKLPWGGFLGFDEKIEYIADNGDIIDTLTDRRFNNKRMVYLTGLSDTFYIKELYSKRYICNDVAIANKKDVVLDYLNKQVIGIRNNQGFVIETSFTGPGKTGYYKAHLEDKYFYHVTKETDISKINSKDIIPLSKDIGVEEKVDLLDISRIRKI